MGRALNRVGSLKLAEVVGVHNLAAVASVAGRAHGVKDRRVQPAKSTRNKIILQNTVGTGTRVYQTSLNALTTQL